MTPEQRERLIDLLIESQPLKEFEALINEIVAAERESCAQVAELFIPSGFIGEGKAGGSYAIARDDRARTIAAAIRARS